MSSKINYGPVIEIPLSEISLYNYRETYDPATLAELATTIAKSGVIQPVTVRMKPKGGYQLIVGARRYKASEIAGKATIPAFVREISDTEIPYMQLVENLQREDVHVLEEAKQIQASAKSLNAEEIARVIGKSEQYVYDRLNLKRLNSVVANLVKKNELTMAHALQFIRLNVADQLDLLEKIRFNTNYADSSTEHKYRYLPASDTRKLVEKEFMLSLSKACFSTDEKYKHANNKGPCATCNMRSGYNKTLFHGIEEDDKCFNRDCFDSKTKCHLETVEKALQEDGKHVVKLYTDMFGEKPGNGVKSFFEVPVVPEKEFANVESNTYGLIVDSSDPKKLGKVVKLYETKPAPGTKKAVDSKESIDVAALQVTKMESLRKANAHRALKNKLGGMLAECIGSTVFSKLPRPVVKILSFNKFMSLDAELRNEFIEGLRWKMDGVEIVDRADYTPAQLMAIFSENTQSFGFKADKWDEFACALTVFEAVKTCEVGDASFAFLFDMVREFSKEDEITKSMESISKTFDVDLNTTIRIIDL